jgi:hypothetical protein
MNKNISEKDWKGIGVDEFDTVRQFVDNFGTFPNNTIYYSSDNYGYIIYDNLVKGLKDLGAVTIFITKTFNDKNETVRVHYFKVKDSFLLVNLVSSKEASCFPDNEFENKFVKVAYNLTVLHTTESVCTEIHNVISDSRLTAVIKPSVSIISRDSNGYYLNDIVLETPICMDLDLHYGDGFELFHETLLETKLLTTNKGISLLNGKPGTGKTYYINRLIYDLKKTSKKKIILVPANMVSYILEPEFNTFLLDIVNSFHFDYDDEEIELEDEEIDEIKEGIILILEDAEPILMKREMSGNSQATSNILNLTDGLLNNIFKIQIIATYNTDDNNIDKAILRDKRLVAKRTFNELSLDDTIRLMKHLGFETEGVDKGMTLAQIYSVDDTEIDSILIESKNKEKNKNKSNTYL